MRFFNLLILFCCVLFATCRSSRNASQSDEPVKQETPKETSSEDGQIRPTKLPPHTKTVTQGGYSTISGIIKDVNGEPAFGATVVLKSNNAPTMGIISDVDGKFSLKSIPKGEYTITISLMGYVTQVYGPLKLDGAYEINFDLIEIQEMEIILLKPILYLYPTDTIDVNVRLDYKGELIHTYPRYSSDGWQVTAHPDGTLFDANGRSYYALFWEGNQNYADIPTSGIQVAGHESLVFLENALSMLGLNEREANEFILFWLPQMEKNAYNLVHFSTEAYAASVPLHVEPKPDTQLRIMMSLIPLHHPIDFPIQQLPTHSIKRNGFTVVEWGGQILPFQMLQIPGH